MSTENLPPVATAGGPPTATGSTVLHVPVEAAVFDQEFLDNYDLEDVEGGVKNGPPLLWLNHHTIPLDCLQGLPCILCWRCNQQDANNNKSAQRRFMLAGSLPCLVPLTPLTTRISTWIANKVFFCHSLQKTWFPCVGAGFTKAATKSTSTCTVRD